MRKRTGARELEDYLLTRWSARHTSDGSRTSDSEVRTAGDCQRGSTSYISTLLIAKVLLSSTTSANGDMVIITIPHNLSVSGL